VDAYLQGRGSVRLAPNPRDASVLAGIGSTNVLRLWNLSNKELEHSLPAPGTLACLACSWSPDGSLLAVLQESCPSLLIHHVDAHSQVTIQLPSKSPQFLAWSPVIEEKSFFSIAIGTAKGSVLIVKLANHLTGDFYSIERLETGIRFKVSSGCWSSEGRLIVALENRQVYVCETSGSVNYELKLKSIPKQVTRPFLN